MAKAILHKKAKRRAPPRIVVESRSGFEMGKAFRQMLGAAVTYQLERVKCGKPKCRKWHGPYWYAYWSAGGTTRTIYIGKKLRPAADVAAELIEPTTGEIE